MEVQREVAREPLNPLRVGAHRRHPTISAVALGAVRLKNVGYRLSVFAVSNDGLSALTLADVPLKAEGEGEPDSIRPSRVARPTAA